MIRLVEVANTRLQTTRHSSYGPAIVFLHGGPGMWDYLAPVAKLFADSHTTLTYHQRGCGLSPGEPPYDVATAVADLDAVRDAWGVDRWTVFGHSWGASLGLAYAVAHPARTRGLVYVSGTGVDPAWHDEYRANRRARLGPEDDKEAANLADPTKLPRLLTWLHADGFAINHAANHLLGQDANRVIESEQFREQVRQLDTPTLILHGAVDPRPARFAAQLADLIPGAELAILPNVGHYPRFEDPDAFEKAVRPFLQRVHS